MPLSLFHRRIREHVGAGENSRRQYTVFCPSDVQESLYCVMAHAVGRGISRQSVPLLCGTRFARRIQYTVSRYHVRVGFIHGAREHSVVVAVHALSVREHSLVTCSRTCWRFCFLVFTLKQGLGARAAPFSWLSGCLHQRRGRNRGRRGRRGRRRERCVLCGCGRRWRQWQRRWRRWRRSWGVSGGSEQGEQDSKAHARTMEPLLGGRGPRLVEGLRGERKGRSGPKVNQS